MAEKLALQPGEEVLFRAPISLVTGKLATRTGKCYVTTQRIIVDSESFAAGAAASVSIISRAILRKTKALGARRQEISLKRLGRVSLGKYGLSRTVDIPLEDGSQLRMVLGNRLTKRFFDALDDALARQEWERVPDGEDSWRMRPKM